jgi:hypothetical protein
MDLRRQLLQQCLRFLQIERVETSRKPPINRSEQFACFPHLALVTPEAPEAQGGAEFPGLRSLLVGDCECALEVRFSFRCIRTSTFVPHQKLRQCGQIGNPQIGQDAPSRSRSPSRPPKRSLHPIVRSLPGFSAVNIHSTNETTVPSGRSK